jgi:xylan 1,4-beta-xylosidase
VYLKIVAEKQKRSFYFSCDGENWILIVTENDCSFLCGESNTIGKHHTGTMVGMYAHNPAYAFVDADFDWFEIDT